MQTEATDAFDVTGKGAAGDARPVRPGVFARSCLVARRLAERGVRFVQLYHGAGQPWDSHDDIHIQHRNLARECDQGIGGLADRPQAQARDAGGDPRDLGRRVRAHPTVELPTPGSNAGKMNGRDHNHYGFTYWMAGGGVKGGPRPRRDGRLRLQGGAGPRPRPRSPRDDPAPPGLRPHEAHLPPRGPRLPPDRRVRQRGPRSRRVIVRESAKPSALWIRAEREQVFA